MALFSGHICDWCGAASGMPLEVSPHYVDGTWRVNLCLCCHASTDDAMIREQIMDEAVMLQNPIDEMPDIGGGSIQFYVWVDVDKQARAEHLIDEVTERWFTDNDVCTCLLEEISSTLRHANIDFLIETIKQ